MALRTSEGFTLIELMIVVTVIAILVGFGGTSYFNSRQSSRDATRIGDLKALQQAFELFYGDQTPNHTYDAVCSDMAADYIRGEYPTDPLGVGGGHVEYNENCQVDQYCVCAQLERVGLDRGNACDNACDFTGPCVGARDWFCVENQQ